MAFFMLTIFYLLIDVFQIWNGAPCIYPGEIYYFSAIKLYTLFEFIHFQLNELDFGNN